MALGDENAEDEKEEKPKVYKSSVDSEDAASTSRNAHRPAALAGVGDHDDVKLEKNDVCLEADFQPCPSTSGSTSATAAASADASSHPLKDVSSAAISVNGASPKSGNGKPSGTATSSAANTIADSIRSTAFTRTQPNRINGLDAFMNGLSANANYYVGMPPGLAYLAAAGPSSGGSSTAAHGVIHPMASYPHNLPVLYQAAATAHLMGNRFPGSPNSALSPFSFQQGTTPFAGFSPCYPTTPDGGQTVPPAQAATGQASFPFALCGDPKAGKRNSYSAVGIRSPFGFFAGGQCSPSFGTPMVIQPTALEQWYAAAQRYTSPIFPLMMTAAAAAAAPVPCSPSAACSPIINSSPIAGGAPTFTAAALAPPTLVPAYPGSPYINNGLRFPPTAASSVTNALAAMSQIPLPAVTTSVKNVASNMVASASSSSASRNSLAQNGSTSSIVSSALVKNRNGSSAAMEHRIDENGTTTNSGSVHASGTRPSHEKASKKSTHIKKPLNAFMLYMKEMRPTVMQEVGLKERQSAEINRILGRRWHSLSRDEQQKYYDLARHERTLHMQRYPNWSARDNYALHKKKKRKRDKAHENLEMKKCRARFGLDQQVKWCKHCRRKKKCLWFREGNGASASASSSSGVQENGATDSFEQSPPCAQVTSTTSGPDALPSSATVLTTETDVNSPQSLVSSTISIAVGGRAAAAATSGMSKKRTLVSAAAVAPKNGTNGSGQSPHRKKSRRTESIGGDCTDDDDGDASSGDSGDEDASSDEDEFDDDEEIDEEAEAAAAARAAVEGADFDEELATLISPPSTDNNLHVDEGQSSTVT